MKLAAFRLKISGIFLYALFDGNFTRATTDIDLLAQKTSNEVENIKKIFKEIFLIEVDDALCYDLDSFDVHSIIEFKAYHGVNVSIVAYLDRTKIPISIDIGFDDIVAFEKGFAEDAIRKSRWKSFIKKKKAMESVDFGTAVDLIKDFLQPIVEKIIDNVEMNIQWKSQKKGWK